MNFDIEKYENIIKSNLENIDVNDMTESKIWKIIFSIGMPIKFENKKIGLEIIFLLFIFATLFLITKHLDENDKFYIFNIISIIIILTWLFCSMCFNSYLIVNYKNINFKYRTKEEVIKKFQELIRNKDGDGENKNLNIEIEEMSNYFIKHQNEEDFGYQKLIDLKNEEENKKELIKIANELKFLNKITSK